MTGAEILRLVMATGPGLLSYFKRERALSKAQKYLCDKYTLEVQIKDNGSTSVMAIYRVFPVKWRRTVSERLRAILSEHTPTLQLADTCADFVLLIAVLAARASDLGPYFGTGADHSYASDLRGSNTFTSLENLSRGIGGDVAIQWVHRELQDWSERYRLLE